MLITFYFVLDLFFLGWIRSRRWSRLAVSVGLLSLIRSNFRRSLGVIRSRSAVGSSFRSAVICGAVAVCLVAFYFALSMAFICLAYNLAFDGLRSLCGRSMVCGLS